MRYSPRWEREVSPPSSGGRHEVKQIHLSSGWVVLRLVYRIFEYIYFRNIWLKLFCLAIGLTSL